MRQLIPKPRTSRSGAGMEVIRGPGKEDPKEAPRPKQGQVRVRDRKSLCTCNRGCFNLTTDLGFDTGGCEMWFSW